MSQTAVEQFFGRVLTDSEFLSQVLTHGKATAYNQGFSFTETEWEAIEETDIRKLASLSPVINKRLKRENISEIKVTALRSISIGKKNDRDGE